MSGPTIATTNAKDTFTKDTKISFARTSDAVGSHNTFHNIDASLNLIRRRILQRCNSIHELLMVIRRIKITESKFITLSEFKHVLVKFGVILDSEVISQVFGKFCDGRTGSMDFEGFARWVNMPEGGVIAKGAKRDKGGAAAKMTTNGSGGNGVALNKAQEMQVRQKLLDVMTYLPSIFGSGSIVTEIDFDGLSSAVFNLDAPGLNKITDREIRTLFATLDTNKSGMVNIATITKYAQTGQVVLPAIKHCLADRDFSLIPSLETCISRVCGTDRSVAHKCFSKLPRNSPLKLKFSEFQKLLLTEGLGRNTSDAEELFIALGGDDDNSADIGLLLATLAKMKADEEEEQKKMIMKKPNVMEFPLSKEQRKAIAMARGVDFLEETKMQASYSDGQFDRTNRMRAEGPPLTAGTALIQTIGTSRAERHFREAIRKSYKVVKDECKVLDHNNTGYIDAEQLLKVVNKYCQAIPMEDFRFILQPVRADERGRVSWQHFLFVYNPSKDLHPLTHTIAGVKHGGAAHGHGHGHGHESTFGSKSNLGMGLSGTNSPLPGISGSPHKGMSRANSPPKLNLQMQASSNNNDLETQFNKKLKKCWQKLLKECQMIDSKRTGQIDQDSFEKAIQTSGLEQIFGESKSQLVNNFSAGGGKIDYVNCMRKFLTQSESKMGKTTSSSTFHPRAETHAREIKPKHPWEFEYKRLQNAAPADPEHPSHVPESSREKGTLYWQQACAAPRADVKQAMADPMHQRGKKLYACDLIKRGYSAMEKGRFFNQFENHSKLFHLFRKTLKAIGGDAQWKRMRSQFKKLAEPPRNTSLKNSIDVTTENFHEVLHDNHLSGITNSDVYTLSHAFRGMGMPEVVRVDEFWATLKILEADDQQRGFDWEADDLLRAQHDIEVLEGGF